LAKANTDEAVRQLNRELLKRVGGSLGVAEDFATGWDKLIQDQRATLDKMLAGGVRNAIGLSSEKLAAVIDGDLPKINESVLQLALQRQVAREGLDNVARQLGVDPKELAQLVQTPVLEYDQQTLHGWTDDARQRARAAIGDELTRAGRETQLILNRLGYHAGLQGAAVPKPARERKRSESSSKNSNHRAPVSEATP
jgi:hypothetical protein